MKKSPRDFGWFKILFKNWISGILIWLSHYYILLLHKATTSSFHELFTVVAAAAPLESVREKILAPWSKKIKLAGNSKCIFASAIWTTIDRKAYNCSMNSLTLFFSQTDYLLLACYCCLQLILWCLTAARSWSCRVAWFGRSMPSYYFRLSTHMLELLLGGVDDRQQKTLLFHRT